MSRTRQINNNSNRRNKTILVSYQIQENLIEPFNDKVTRDFGYYKKSKVLNALIEGYLTGRYRVANIQESTDYDIEC